MAIKLVLCDMDGTLVPFGSRGVSTRTINSIHALMDVGIHFGPSSGRALCDLVSFFSGDEACINTGILANGKLVFVDGELVYRRPIPRVALSELVEALYGIHDAVFNFYLPVDERGRGPAGFGAAGASPQELAALSSAIGEPFSGGLYQELPDGDIVAGAVLVNPERAGLNEVQALLREACPDLDFPFSGPFVMDVVEKGWSKLNALPVIQEALGVELDEIAYFGDSHNDLTMMEAIPNAFCPSGGLDEAKALARWVIGACEDDCVAQVLDSLVAHGGELVPSDWS